MAVAGPVSVTVAVQLVGLPTGTEAGEQLTVVVVVVVLSFTMIAFDSVRGELGFAIQMSSLYAMKETLYVPVREGAVMLKVSVEVAALTWSGVLTQLTAPEPICQLVDLQRLAIALVVCTWMAVEIVAPGTTVTGAPFELGVHGVPPFKDTESIVAQSVNVVCAVQLEAKPVAVARNRTPTSDLSGLVRNSLLVKAPAASAVAVRFVSGSPLDSRMLMATCSFGRHPSPISVTVSPGA